MNSPSFLLASACLCLTILPATGEPASPVPPVPPRPSNTEAKNDSSTSKGGPASPAASPLDLIRYKPKAGRAAGGVERSVIAATRSGESDLRLVALSPGKGAATILGKPVLWWHQSTSTRNGELQLTLTKMVGNRPSTLFSSRLTARQAGFQSADLADLTVNPRGLSLEPEVTYQWSLSVIGGKQKAGVYATLAFVPDAALDQKLKDEPDAPATLTSLADSGNWHELFGRLATTAQKNPSDSAAAKARDGLLEQVGLLKNLKLKQP